MYVLYLHIYIYIYTINIYIYIYHTYIYIYVFIDTHIYIHTCLYFRMLAPSLDILEVLLLPLLIGPSDTLTKTMPEAASAASDLQATWTGRIGCGDR